MKLPKAKTDNIVVQELKDELLVYNLTTHQAFTLNETLKIIYQWCDGNTSFADLQRSFKFTDDLIHLALSELSTNDLLIDYQSDHFAGLSRREAIKRVGLASLIALPVISSLVAPTAAMAASNVRQANNTTCTALAVGRSAECQSGNCVISFNEDGSTSAPRCCATANGIANGTTGFFFLGADQASCSLSASNGVCCSGKATYQGNGDCTCDA